MGNDELDLVPTEALLNALSRRTKAFTFACYMSTRNNDAEGCTSFAAKGNHAERLGLVGFLRRWVMREARKASVQRPNEEGGIAQ
jgi:hypothetical protein